MNDTDLLSLLPAWVRDDVPASDEQALQRAAAADPELARLADALRATQLRAVEVLEFSPPAPTTTREVTDTATAPRQDAPSTTIQRPGRNAFLVALSAGVLAVVLGSAVVLSLLASPPPSAPPPVTDAFSMVFNDSLAPLARSHPEDAARSLEALGVPSESATPPDLSGLDLAFSSATALPGPTPGAAFEYIRGSERILVQSARVLTAPPGAEVRTLQGRPVYWTVHQGHPVALWHDGDVHRAVTGTVSEDSLEAIVNEWMTLSAD